MPIEVVAAIIFFNKKIIVTQRKFSKNPDFSLKFEFPGGKVEKEEDHMTALKRELIEELDLNVYDINFFDSYSFRYSESFIKLNFFTCKTNNIDFKIKVHEDLKLVDVNQLKDLDWLEADYKVIKKIESVYL